MLMLGCTEERLSLLLFASAKGSPPPGEPPPSSARTPPHPPSQTRPEVISSIEDPTRCSGTHRGKCYCKSLHRFWPYLTRPYNRSLYTECYQKKSVLCHRLAALFVVDRLKSEVVTSAITHYQHVAVLQARRHILKRIINRHKVKKPDERKVCPSTPAAKDYVVIMLMCCFRWSYWYTHLMHYMLRFKGMSYDFSMLFWLAALNCRQTNTLPARLHV